MSRWACSGSVICLPIFISGFSDVIGSWKIIDISWPQMWRICLGVRSIISWPSNRTDPVRSTLRAVEQAHDRAGQHRLARARLADDAERLAAVERERHAVDGAHRARVACGTTCAGR